MPTWGKDFAASFADGTDTTSVTGSPPCGKETATRTAGYAVTTTRTGPPWPASPSSCRTGRGRPTPVWSPASTSRSPAREGDPVSATDLYGDYLSTHRVSPRPGKRPLGRPEDPQFARARPRPPAHLDRGVPLLGLGRHPRGDLRLAGPVPATRRQPLRPARRLLRDRGGWWEWAPPSTCWRQPYWPDYKVFSDTVTRLCALLSAGQLVADTVLLYPTSIGAGRRPAGGPAARGAARPPTSTTSSTASTSWFDERPGVLDRAGTDYEIFDEAATGGRPDRRGHLAGRGRDVPQRRPARRHRARPAASPAGSRSSPGRAARW